MILVWIALAAGLTVWGSMAAGAPMHVPSNRKGKESASLDLALPLLALPVLATVFWALRTRTYFLGDGIVWVSSLTSGQFPHYSEPLASEVWHGWVTLLRALGLPVDATTLAGLPVVCGLAASTLLWLLAGEIAATRQSRILSVTLLLTLGVSQLYFGYIESYPFVCVTILLYLVLSMRAARTDAGVDLLLPGLALAVAAASHLLALYLAPSYLWLVLRSPATAVRKALLLLLPVAACAGLLFALKTGPEDLLRPFRSTTSALEGGTGSFGFAWRGLTSPQRWLDLVNLALLIAPVPLILLAATGESQRGAAIPRPPGLPFLIVAAAPGLAASVFLAVPSSPAQDWDILALLLIPAAVAAICIAIPVLERGRWQTAAGICLLAGVGLFSFVLVNADERAGIGRFKALVGESASLGSHERAYGDEKLATFYAARGDFSQAFHYARHAIDAEPTNPRYWVKAGGALVGMGHPGDAVPYFEEALRRAPGRADASYNLGICEAKLGRVNEAIVAFRSAVAADPNRPEYRHNLGVTLYRAGQIDSARLVWNEVLYRWPDFALTSQSMARHFGAASPQAP